MNELMQQVDEILKNDAPDRHSFFQLRFFVVDAEPTLQGKFQACIRELKTRRQSMENMQLESHDLVDKSALLAIELERVLDEEIEVNDAETARQKKQQDIEAKVLRRKILVNDRQLRELQKKIKFYGEECQFFVEYYNQLKEQDEVKQWDDVEVQKEYWDAKVGQTIHTRLLLGLPLDEELVKAALTLPDDSPVKKETKKLLETQRKLMLEGSKTPEKDN